MCVYIHIYIYIYIYIHERAPPAALRLNLQSWERHAPRDRLRA